MLLLLGLFLVLFLTFHFVLFYNFFFQFRLLNVGNVLQHFKNGTVNTHIPCTHVHPLLTFCHLLSLFLSLSLSDLRDPLFVCLLACLLFLNQSERLLVISMSFNPNYFRKDLRGTFCLHNHNVIITLRKFNIDNVYCLICSQYSEFPNCVNKVLYS